MRKKQLILQCNWHCSIILSRMKSAKLSSDDVFHIAKLANLPIDQKQQKVFEQQLSAILAFVSKLQKVPTKNIQPTAQITGITNVYREDVVGASRMLTQKQALKNAKETKNGYFVVPSVWT